MEILVDDKMWLKIFASADAKTVTVCYTNLVKRKTENIYRAVDKQTNENKNWQHFFFVGISTEQKTERRKKNI